MLQIDNRKNHSYAINDLGDLDPDAPDKEDCDNLQDSQRIQFIRQDGAEPRSKHIDSDTEDEFVFDPSRGAKPYKDTIGL